MQEMISVIVPVYNVERYIKQCLDSLVHQTYCNKEIVLIDDGSKDGSGSICDEYSSRYDFVKAIHKENAGLGMARNTGLENITGKYVKFVDSDDLIRKDTCEKLYKNAKENDLDMLCFSGYNFTETPQSRQKNPYWSYDKVLLSLCGKKVFNMQDIKEIIHVMPVSACLTIYRNSFLKKYDIEFPMGLYYEDNVFYVKASTKADRISIDSDEYYMRRIREGSTTKSWDKHFSDYFDITEIVLQYLRDIYIDESIYNNYKKNYLGMSLGLYRVYGQKRKKDYLKIKNLITKYGKPSEYPLNYPHSHPFLAFIFLPCIFFKFKVLKRRLCQHILAEMSTIRVDIKGTSNNKSNAIEVEALNATITAPIWFRDTRGAGQVLTSCARKGKIKISVINTGKLMMAFRGPDMRFDGQRFPLWIDYKSIKIDGKRVLFSPVETWHDKPWRYEMFVKGGQVVFVEYEQQIHPYSRKELKETILKLNPTSEVIQENINVLTDEIKKMIKLRKIMH